MFYKNRKTIPLAAHNYFLFKKCLKTKISNKDVKRNTLIFVIFFSN